MNVDHNSHQIIRQSKNYLLTKLHINPQIPALMIKPTTPPPYPAIFFLHYYRGSKENIQFLANELGKSGFMALAIDMEYHGDRTQAGKDILSPDIENDKKAFYKTINDSLIALRFIENHPDFDHHSLFFWGVSLGSLIGSIVCAQHRKFKGIALVVGGGNIEILARESLLDSMVNIRYSLLKKKISPFDLAQQWKDIDPLHWISHLDQVPVFFFNASQDVIVPLECTWALFDVTTSPKKIFWFPTGHGLLFERYFGVPRKIIGLFSQIANQK
ncbi:MAG: dienelactone hydrolase family protein [Atribacterota bacterium]|jgi:esterase/lipase|nr:dienelactone hydrolase family protein [Atribacterota bacterium]